MSEFKVMDQNGVIANPAVCLQKSSYYKSYSLYLANCNSIPILDTLVILSESALDSPELSRSLLKEPIMLRMDYAHINHGKKYIGGIPVYSYSSLQSLCAFLFSRQYIPLLQTYINRFEDKYSINCCFGLNSSTLSIESVGKGFDAGDLRLGLLNPHEVILFNFDYWEIKERKIIGKEEYEISRESRNKYISKMIDYIEYVNSEHKLLHSIDNLAGKKYSGSMDRNYAPLAKKTIDDISFWAYKIQKELLPQLPDSDDYVASFSILENEALVLWDIYGKWYYR
jgi:hypothetical protein